MNIGIINASYPFVKTQKEKEQRVKATFEATFNKEKQKQNEKERKK